MVRMSVVLPEPFGPVSSSASPGTTLRDDIGDDDVRAPRMTFRFSATSCTG